MENRETVISQQTLSILLQLEGVIRQRWEFYEREARAIERQFAAGARVEPGEHTVTTREGAAVGEASLMVDGRPILPSMEQTIGKDSAESLFQLARLR